MTEWATQASNSTSWTTNPDVISFSQITYYNTSGQLYNTSGETYNWAEADTPANRSQLWNVSTDVTTTWS